ncbi:MAG: AI-2E family transporter [Myxococcaceae bacterium]
MAAHSSQVSPRTIWTIALHLLLIAGTVVVVLKTWTVITLILIALFVALALDPAVSLLRDRLRIRRGFAVLAVFIAGLALLSAMFGTVIPMVVEQAQHLAESAPDLAQRLQEHSAFRWAQERFHIIESIGKAARGITVAPVVEVAGRILAGVASALAILSLTVFALLFGGDLFNSALKWVHPKERQRVRVLARRMHVRVGGYVSGTLLLAAIGGLVMGVTLAIVGNPYFLPLGLVMAVFAIIPWVGTAIATSLIVATTLASQGFKQAVVVILVYVAYQPIENHVLQPLIQKRTIRMNPLLIAIVMLIGTAMVGLLGTVLALPVAGAVQVFLQDLLRRRRETWAAQKNAEVADTQLTFWQRESDVNLPH